MEEPAQEIQAVPEQEQTISLRKVHTTGLGLGLLLYMFLNASYALIWSMESLRDGWKLFGDHILLALLLGIVSHELLHGLTWGYFSKNKWRSISFGMKWKWLAPYTHCNELMKVGHYRLGALMPLNVLGLTPWVLGIVLGHGFLAVFGSVFTFAAIGDIMIAYKIRNVPSHLLVQDHPSKLGCILVDPTTPQNIHENESET